MLAPPEEFTLPRVGLPRYLTREAPLASTSSRPLTFTVAELAPLTPLRLPLPGFDNHATRGHHVEGKNTIVDPLVQSVCQSLLKVSNASLILSSASINLQRGQPKFSRTNPSPPRP
jgi:hypothetical protein